MSFPHLSEFSKISRDVLKYIERLPEAAGDGESNQLVVIKCKCIRHYVCLIALDLFQANCLQATHFPKKHYERDATASITRSLLPARVKYHWACIYVTNNENSNK